MTVKKIRICDICGKQFDKYADGQAKIKIRDCNYVNYDDWEHMKWRKYDVCPDCTKRLITEIAKEMK